MTSFLKQHLPKLLIVPLVLLGVLGFKALTASKKAPTLRPPGERGVAVRYVTVEAHDVVPRSVAHGAVRPQRSWTAVSQVAGRIVEMPDRLRAGAFVREGELLFAVDPTQYRIDVATAGAQVGNLGAQLAELDVQKRQYESKLRIQKEQYDLAKRDLDRLVRLESTGGVSTSEMEQQRRVVLDYESAALTLQQSIELVPTRRAVLEKQKAAEESRLERATLDLARCRITAPFDARLASVDVEQGQVVAVGSALCVADGVDVAEVAVPFGFQQLGRFRTAAREITFEELTSAGGFRDAFPVAPTVRFHAPGRTVAWPARLLRLESVRGDTRTIPVVVGVDKPYEGAVPGIRPPLVKGMFVEVELRGEALSDRIVVPRDALRQDGTVPVADEDDRLRFRAVEVAFFQGALAVVRSGLEVGDRIVVTDVIPAVEGMLLRPVPDAQLAARLRAAAAGEGDVR